MKRSNTTRPSTSARLSCCAIFAVALAGPFSLSAQFDEGGGGAVVERKDPLEVVESAESGKENRALFIKNPAGHDAKGKDVIHEVGILLEYIQVDHRTANKFIREYAPKSSNVQGLRDELEKMIDAGTADLLETTWIRSRSGNRAKTESVIEDPHATEYDPPEIPNITGSVQSIEPKDGGSSKTAEGQSQKLRESLPPVEGNFPMTHANPTAFEIRNVGITLEVDPVIAADNSSIELNLAPELVERLDDEYFTREGMEETARGIDHIEMHVFYTMRTTTQLSMIPGNYTLLGIHTPHDNKNDRILVLLRADLIPIR